jgi:hypothetical protein
MLLLEDAHVDQEDQDRRYSSMQLQHVCVCLSVCLCVCVCVCVYVERVLCDGVGDFM